MPDYAHGLFKWIDHNRSLSVSVAVSVALMVNIAGCQPKATNPVTGEMATEAQIVSDIQAYLAKIEGESKAIMIKANASIEEIHRQRDVVDKLTETVVGLAAATPYGGVVGTIIGILGIGAGVDNRRKDKIIKKTNPVTPLV